MDAFVQGIASALEPAGLHIHQVSVQDYNEDPECGRFPLPTYGRPNTLGILIYNTKALWKPFISYLSADPEQRLVQPEHPLDDYAHKIVTLALENALAPGVQYDVRFPHEMGRDFVHFQRLSHVARLAFHNQHCYLCVHPTYGPWMALRAAIIVDMDGPPKHGKLPELSDPYPAGNVRIQELLSELRCRAVANGLTLTDVYRDNWETLLEIRDAAGQFLGKSIETHRYGTNQISYHYTKDKDYLWNSIKDLEID
ncbi:hypothetical protein HDU85_004138 [Gaertneriomyces sp. JEL0708]|nr:hypothetical protein HDU85_004138 [Gaertneriomyces sp. JEL0708]